jgi:hypothetical protein
MYTLMESEGLSTFSLFPLAHDCERSALFDYSDGFLGIPLQTEWHRRRAVFFLAQGFIYGLLHMVA